MLREVAAGSIADVVLSVAIRHVVVEDGAEVGDTLGPVAAGALGPEKVAHVAVGVERLGVRGRRGSSLSSDAAATQLVHRPREPQLHGFRPDGLRTGQHDANRALRLARSPQMSASAPAGMPRRASSKWVPR